jgi:hypothetical protein
MAFGTKVYAGSANKGTDIVVQLRRNDTGAVINFGGRMQDFDYTDNDTIENIEGIDNAGRTDHIYHAGDIGGNITVTRFNGDMEDFAKFCRANFFAQGPTIYCTMVTQIGNQFDSTSNQNTYTEVVLSKFKSGPWQSKSAPKVSFNFVAQELK